MTAVIYLQEGDDLAVLRDRLRRAQDGRVVLVLPWESSLFSRPLDAELVRREAERLGLEIAIVSEDPERRRLVRLGGLPVFPSVERAKGAREWPRPEQPVVEPPSLPWWEEKPPLIPPPSRPLPPWVRHARQGSRLLVFVLTLLSLLASAYIIVPTATITLVPQGETITTILPVSIVFDPEMEEVDIERGLVPARRVGDYFEGYIEVETTGTTAYESGRATGTVLFTNLLAQEVTVPAGTVVRTSSGSFPIRFATTQDVTVPPLGQAPAPIEALEEGPVGNVGPNQINQVLGVAGLALRVTNPEPTTGGAAQEVRAVSQEDMDRARALLTQQLLDEACEGLKVYLEPTEFLPCASLEIQASEVAYNRFLTERADTLGAHMRLLITGLAVDRGNVGTVAYASLSHRLPSGYTLVAFDFEVGEAAEEPIGEGDLTFFVTATGYTAAEIDQVAIRKGVAGRPVPRAAEWLTSEMPLAAPPSISIWPEWLNRVPVLPPRIEVRVVAQM